MGQYHKLMNLDKMEDTYTIYRIDSWDDQTWEAVIEAVEDTTASFGDGWKNRVPDTTHFLH